MKIRNNDFRIKFSFDDQPYGDLKSKLKKDTLINVRIN